jgi:T5orf172 domain-containing protein
MARGFIYVLINPAMPGLLKIGKTSGSSEDRAAELSAVTGLPTPFVVACDWNTSDCDAAELEVHARLEKSRYSKEREFFRLPLKEAIQIVSEICGRFEPQLADSQTKIRMRPHGEVFSAAFSCQKCRQKYSVTMRYPEKEVVCPSCQNRQSYPVEWSSRQQ